MAFVSSDLTSTSGATLKFYSQTTEKNAKAAVMILHGMAEHGARYQRFADALAAAGYHVFAHDHRGHGKTRADTASQGIFAKQNGDQKVMEDVVSVNHYIRENYPDLPIVLFGHSMGAIIGLNYCIRHSGTISAAALWNSGVDAGLLLVIYRALLGLERMFKGSDVASTIAHKLTFSSWNKKFAPNRTDFDWLSRDEAEVDKYVTDPDCGFPVTNGLWFDLTKMIQIAANDTMLANIRDDLPIHLLGGKADPCTDNGQAMVRLETRLKETGISDLECTLLDDTRHETLNELNRDEATQKFIAWLDARFG